MELKNPNIMSHTLGPYGAFIQLKPLDLKAGHAKIELPIREEYKNPFGYVHCGVIYSLVEYAMGYAVQSILDEKEMSATIQANIHFISGIREGSLICESKITKEGKQVAYLQSIVFCKDKVVAESMGTYFLRRNSGKS